MAIIVENLLKRFSVSLQKVQDHYCMHRSIFEMLLYSMIVFSFKYVQKSIDYSACCFCK